MGLYDDRMSDLSEPRHNSRTAGRRSRTHPYPRSSPSSRSTKSSEARKRDPMEVQSLLFSRDGSWTVAKAKAWAKEHDYKYGKVDVTEQYIRIRQFSPKGLKVKRTITLGRGIRAVVAREETMAGTKARSPRKVSAPRKRSKRRKTKARTTAARRRRKSTVMAAPKRRRRKTTAKKRPTRRRHARASEAWYGDTAGHRRAAKKGVRRRKRRRAAPKRRRRTTRRRTSEPSMVAAPRRRRTTRRRSAPRRRTYASAPRRGNTGLGVGEFLVAVGTAGLGYVVADGLDRFLATYDPASTEEKPKDKFTSDGAGTLANTLNVASPPGLMRIGAGVGITAVPAVASMYIDNTWGRAALQGLAIGSGVNLFKTLWNNVLMPMLKPKDTSAASLQKSYIARLYPAEIAASINREAKQTAVSSAGGAGALSGAPANQAGVAQPPDVGPFALQDSPGYPDAAQALRQQAGMEGTPGNDYPTVQNVWGTGGESDFPTATQAITEETGIIGDLGAFMDVFKRVGVPAASVQDVTRRVGAAVKAKGMVLKCVPAPGLRDDQSGVSQEPAPPWEPGPPPLPGPGPQAAPGEDPACACLNDGDQFLGFIGDEPTEEALYSTT